MKKFFGIWVLAATLLLFAFPAGAEDVVSQAGKGKVNWTQKVITFTGDGAPNLEGPNRAMNAAQARLGAERAAKMMALRQALEVVKGIQLDAQGTAGDAMQGNAKIAAFGPRRGQKLECRQHPVLLGRWRSGGRESSPRWCIDPGHAPSGETTERRTQAQRPGPGRRHDPEG